MLRAMITGQDDPSRWNLLQHSSQNYSCSHHMAAASDLKDSVDALSFSCRQMSTKFQPRLCSFLSCTAGVLLKSGYRERVAGDGFLPFLSVCFCLPCFKIYFLVLPEILCFGSQFKNRIAKMQTLPHPWSSIGGDLFLASAARKSRL